MTLVQWLAMVYLADEQVGIPVAGRGEEARANLALALSQAQRFNSPEARLRQAEEIYQRHRSRR